jgi:asparaginyl-tRNA synthetase
MEWESISKKLEGKFDNDFLNILGRIKKIRLHKKIAFVDIIDYSSEVQLIIEKDKTPDLYDEISTYMVGSYISVDGNLSKSKNGKSDLIVSDLEILAESGLVIESPWNIDGLNPHYGNLIFSNLEIYVSNPQRATLIKLKNDFIFSMHKYFQNQGFVLVDPSIITNKTLYGHENAITAQVHGENVYLSQCATFELEPLAMTFGKVYTISPAFRNEKSGSKRHLAEYNHVKAEVLFR